jgi:fibronectin-binding autotransporter adhesin
MKKFLSFIFALMMCLTAYAQTNNTTSPGTMPGGYIGRVLNNTPEQFQNYSFTYTPSQTGSQYVQLAFRQDPAYWTVTNVSLTAAGSSTNLLQNGNFATGGTITAQTNNGPMDVNTPTYWGVAYQSGIYPGAAGTWSPGEWYDGAVGSFDAIYQGVTLTAGVTYTVTITVSGDNTSNTNLDGAVQLGVYAGACSSLTLSPDQCTLSNNSGFTTLATPQQGASAGSPAPTPISSSTSNVVTTSSSVGSTTTTANTYTFGNQNFAVTGTSTPTTTTTTTTPVTTTYWSDGSTTTSNGTSSSTTAVTYNYTVTGPTQAPVSPNAGTNLNSVYITQINAGASNSVTTNQSGHGNYESVSLGGSNNIVRLGQGYTFSTSGVATEAANASNNNLSAVSVSGNFNGIVNSQVGASNSTIISATGNYNSALSTQTGNNNQVYSTISGNNNSLSFGQTGNGNIASANLYGNNNVATVTQTGNNHGTVLNLINAGGANNVSVIQTGTGDAYSLQQTCTNPAGCSVSVIRNK